MISAIDLVKIYQSKEGDVRAVDNVHFTIPKGTIFTLLGPSGCGKSTTLRMLAGLEKPSSGEITIGDKVVYSSKNKILIPANKRAIGMVFQSYAIWPHMTVFQNVAYPLKMKRRMSKKVIEKKVSEVLEVVGLQNVGQRSATRLSGGQQQRVALARAVISEPQALFLDEPLSNLDAILRKQMVHEIKRLQQQIDGTVLYVTHDQQEALAMSDTIAVMNQGKFVQVGSPEEIYNKPRSRFVAEFIGRSNILEAKLTGNADRDICAIETDIGSLRAFAQKGLSDGEKAAVSIRPEKFRISLHDPADGGRSNIFRGRIERLIFLGENIDYDIRVHERLLSVSTKSIEPLLPIGTDVFLSVLPEHAVIISDGKGTET